MTTANVPNGTTVSNASNVLRKTPLNARHHASNARMVPFAGWEMPVEYAGIAAEHMAVRTRAGIFDVSHMGEIEIAGKNAEAAVQRIACSDPATLKVGQAQYSGLLTPDGTFLDDMIIYRMAPIHFLIVVNASNTAKDFAWISEQIKAVGDVAAIDSSSRYALIALAGPASREVLQPLTGVDLGEIAPFWFANGEVANARATIARTGYTGEDGFEIFVPPNMAERVWQALLESGRSVDLVPAGLGARDTLETRSVDAAVRQRHRRDHHRAGSRARMDDRLDERGLHRPRPAARAEGQRHDASAGRLRDDRSRHRPARLPCDRRRHADRRRYQRHADAFPGQGHRDGLCAGRAIAARV